MISTQLGAERAAAVFVDEFEAALSGGKELARELGDLLQRCLALRLARRGALLELVRERLLDALLPARNIDADEWCVSESATLRCLRRGDGVLVA